MKKILILPALLLLSCTTLFAQTINLPKVGSWDTNGTLTKIETNKQFTVVSIEYVSPGDSSWVQLNKEVFLQTNIDNTHYNYVKSENIPLAPAKHYFEHEGNKLLFKIYFKKIPANATAIDLVERAGPRNGGISYFNFYDVSLTQSNPEGTVTGRKVTDIALTAPQPVMNMSNLAEVTPDMTNAMNMMGPMFSNLAKSIMDAQLSYYQQPGKITEVAKLNKAYFDALKKEGFNDEQALKIITSESLLPKASAVNGK